MTTTTAEAIIDKAIAVLRGLSPLTASDLRFDRSPARYDLRTWALQAPCTRRFEIRTDGDRVDPEDTDISVLRVMQPMLITVAYSRKLVGTYGIADLNDLEDVVETDAKQICDALYPTGGLAGDGHIATVPTIGDLDRAHDEVWFQAIPVEAHFWVAQSLTF